MVSPQATKTISSDNEAIAGGRVREENYIWGFYFESGCG